MRVGDGFVRRAGDGFHASSVGKAAGPPWGGLGESRAVDGSLWSPLVEPV